MITYDKRWETLKAKNLSVNQLNKQLGVSKGQISRLKNNMNVSTNTLNRLCALLHCDLQSSTQNIKTQQFQKLKTLQTLLHL